MHDGLPEFLVKRWTFQSLACGDIERFPLFILTALLLICYLIHI